MSDGDWNSTKLTLYTTGNQIDLQIFWRKTDAFFLQHVQDEISP
jgi:hypothetical protein